MKQKSNEGRALRFLTIGLIVGLGVYWAGSRYGSHATATVNARPALAIVNGSETGLDPTETENVRIYRQASPGVANIVTRTVGDDVFYNTGPGGGAVSGL